jgi:hypothetical protein
MPKARVRRSESQWRALIEKWQASGTSARMFAQEENLSSSTFYAIISKYCAAHGDEACRRPSQFIEVAHLQPRVESASQLPSSSITIKLRFGNRVVLQGAVDAAQLRLVMEVVRAC